MSICRTSLSLRRGVFGHAGHQGDHCTVISKPCNGKEVGKRSYRGYSRANGSLPPLPSGARSSNGTAWTWVGRAVPGIIFVEGKDGTAYTLYSEQS